MFNDHIFFEELCTDLAIRSLPLGPTIGIPERQLTKNTQSAPTSTSFDCQIIFHSKKEPPWAWLLSLHLWPLEFVWAQTIPRFSKVRICLQC